MPVTQTSPAASSAKPGSPECASTTQASPSQATWPRGTTRPDWERQAAAVVYGQVRALVEASGGSTARLTREQKGRFVAICWITQIYKHIPDPKPSYVADWDDLPNWQQQTDADIFEHIETEA